MFFIKKSHGYMIFIFPWLFNLFRSNICNSNKYYEQGSSYYLGNSVPFYLPLFDIPNHFRFASLILMKYYYTINIFIFQAFHYIFQKFYYLNIYIHIQLHLLYNFGLIFTVIALSLCISFIIFTVFSIFINISPIKLLYLLVFVQEKFALAPLTLLTVAFSVTHGRTIRTFHFRTPLVLFNYQIPLSAFCFSACLDIGFQRNYRDHRIIATIPIANRIEQEVAVDVARTHIAHVEIANARIQADTRRRQPE